MFQFNRDANGSALTADDVRMKIAGGAKAAQTLQPPPLRVLRPNVHQEVDPHRPVGKKQSDHFGDVIGAGKINVQESI
jgi:hypothetical protein